jgi:hypothetical protein
MAAALLRHLTPVESIRLLMCQMMWGVATMVAAADVMVVLMCVLVPLLLGR